MIRPFTAWLAWLALAAGAVGILYGMIGYWVRGYDGPDRAIIIIASAWLVWSRRAELLSLNDTPRPRLGMALVTVGAIAYLPPWFVYTQIGPRPIILWWEAIALFLATVGLILIRSGPNLLMAVRFSLIFPLFALPLPGRIQNPFQEILQGISSSIAAEIIPLFGVPVLMKRGNEILLPGGGIDVVGACSGLTQVRAILAVAAFIAHIRGFGAGRGLLTLLFAVPTLVIVNSLRVTASGLIHEWTGDPKYIEGTYHELLGLALFVVGLTLVLSFSRLLMKPGDSAALNFTGERPQTSTLTTGFATILLLAVLTAGVGCLTIPGISQSLDNEPDFSLVPSTLGNWTSSPSNTRAYDVERIKETLTFNTARNMAFETPRGDQASAWLIYWKSAMVVKDYHSPDVCNSKHGDTITAAAIHNIVTPKGRHIPLTYREITNGGHNKLVVYWTQEGRRIWTDADEARCASFAFPFLWMSERMAKGRNRDVDDRLVVYVGMPLYKNRSLAVQRAALEDLAGRLADELYDVCPWADPTPKSIQE